HPGNRCAKWRPPRGRGSPMSAWFLRSGSLQIGPPRSRRLATAAITIFAFFPERGSLMDHLPPAPRPQWRRIQLARYLIDYRNHRFDRMRFDANGTLIDFGLPQGEIDAVI